MTPRAGLAVALAFLASACATPRLHKAVEAGNLAEVNRLLDAGEAVDAREGEEDLTPLGWAAAKGSVEIATALLAHGANVNAQSNEGFTPLHNAAYFNHAEMVALLISKGANLTARTAWGETPLHRAFAQHGKYLRNPKVAVPAPRLEAMMATAVLLMDRGADPKATTSDRETPLHLAALTGYKPVVEHLIDRGVAVDAPGPDELTPLHSAALALDRVEVAEELLAHGAKVDARSKSQRTPLWLAAASGAPRVATLLIERGADVNARDASGTPPLVKALWTGSLATRAGDKLMRAHGASARERAEFRGQLAANEGRWRDVAILLIERGADIHARPAKAASPLILAAVAGDVEVARLLLEKGAPIDEVADGETALHAAVAEGQLEVTTLLLAKGASVRVLNVSGRTPLHFAAWHQDDASLVQLLIAHGADVNAVDVQHHTPFWYARNAKNERVMKELMAHGGR